MPDGVSVFVSLETDPFTNLAVENWVFSTMTGPTLLVWRNTACVVIGRHQNPWIECDVRRLRADSIPLVRRQSGGGTVFHDLGNTNFTFLAPEAMYDQDTNFAIVLDALRRCGIDATRNDRNDIVVDGRKVSGSAFKHAKARSFHHGTLLVSADLDRLRGYLHPPDRMLEARGIRSVRSPVINLTEVNATLDHHTVGTALISAATERWRGGGTTTVLDANEIGAIGSIGEYRDTITEWDWRYGNTPEFRQRIDIREGEITIDIVVKRGVISEISIAGTAVDAASARSVETLIIGTRYDDETIVERAGGDSPEVIEIARAIQEKTG
jgi:lipoate-protein ligase A